MSSFLRRTEDLQRLKTRELIVQNTDGTYPAPGKYAQMGATGEVGWGDVPFVVPDGTNYSDYLYWDPASDSWQADSSGTVHLGSNAGFTGQSAYAVAIGPDAGFTDQGQSAVAIGLEAGSTDQGVNAIAIGMNAGSQGQGSESIAIGHLAGFNQQPANTIVLNASGGELDGNTGPALFINPIRQVDDSGLPGVLRYNPGTSEVVYDTTSNTEPSLTYISYPDDADAGLAVMLLNAGTSDDIIDQPILPGKTYLLTGCIGIYVQCSELSTDTIVQVRSNQGWTKPPPSSTQTDHMILNIFPLVGESIYQYNGFISYSFIARSSSLRIYMEAASSGTVEQVNLSMANINLIQLN